MNKSSYVVMHELMELAYSITVPNNYVNYIHMQDILSKTTTILSLRVIQIIQRTVVTFDTPQWFWEFNI